MQCSASVNVNTCWLSAEAGNRMDSLEPSSPDVTLPLLNDLGESLKKGSLQTLLPRLKHRETVSAVTCSAVLGAESSIDSVGRIDRALVSQLIVGPWSIIMYFLANTYCQASAKGTACSEIRSLFPLG